MQKLQENQEKFLRSIVKRLGGDDSKPLSNLYEYIKENAPRYIQNQTVYYAEKRNSLYDPSRDWLMTGLGIIPRNNTGYIPRPAVEERKEVEVLETKTAMAIALEKAGIKIDE